RLPHHLAVHIGDRCRQRNVFGADLYTVLRVAALVNCTVAHYRPQAFTPQVSSGRVQIEQAYLVDDRRTNKSRWLGKLRADRHAETAGHTSRQGICLLLNCRIDAWTWAEVISSVHGDPCVNLLEILEQHGAVDRQVSYNGKS